MTTGFNKHIENNSPNLVENNSYVPSRILIYDLMKYLGAITIIIGMSSSSFSEDEILLFLASIPSPLFNVLEILLLISWCTNTIFLMFIGYYEGIKVSNNRKTLSKIYLKNLKLLIFLMFLNVLFSLFGMCVGCDGPINLSNFISNVIYYWNAIIIGHGTSWFIYCLVIVQTISFFFVKYNLYIPFLLFSAILYFCFFYFDIELLPGSDLAFIYALGLCIGHYRDVGYRFSQFVFFRITLALAFFYIFYLFFNYYHHDHLMIIQLTQNPNVGWTVLPFSFLAFLCILCFSPRVKSKNSRQISSFFFIYLIAGKYVAYLIIFLDNSLFFFPILPIIPLIMVINFFISILIQLFLTKVIYRYQFLRIFTKFIKNEK